MITFYGLPTCSTCKIAFSDLKKLGLDPTYVDIAAQAPSEKEFKKALASGYELKNLLNTSGQVFKELKLKEKIPSMTEREILSLLSSNGRLVKRPFIITENLLTIGWKPEQFLEWKNYVKG